MIGWIILAAVAALIAVLLIRAAMFKPVKPNYPAHEEIAVDKDAAAQRFAQMVRIPTVSNEDESLVDEAQFEKFRQLLTKMYPNVHQKCMPQYIGTKGILFSWKGKSSAESSVLMAHFDVVPVEEAEWKHPPFCGEIFDGELWGRGTLDTKITMFGTLETAEKLIADGFVPENDIYMAFGGDEEVAGHGAIDIVDYFKKNGITPALVIDEGGAVVQGVFPGVKEPMAVVGIGEKGMMNVSITAKGEGGHASHPVLPSTVGTMCRAVVNCEAHPMPAHITLAFREMTKAVGPYSSFGLKVVFANLWCFGGLLCTLANKLGSEMNAMLRTTFAFTQAKGSLQNNVMANEATAGLNVRMVNNDTAESTRQYIEKCIDNKNVDVKIVMSREASPYSATQGEHWDKLSAAIANTWQGCIVSPYLMIACSDSRNYNGFCKDIYKFSAMALTAEQRGLIHNSNERIPVTEIAKTIEFYTRLVKSL